MHILCMFTSLYISLPISVRIINVYNLKRQARNGNIKMLEASNRLCYLSFMLSPVSLFYVYSEYILYIYRTTQFYRCFPNIDWRYMGT